MIYCYVTHGRTGRATAGFIQRYQKFVLKIRSGYVFKQISRKISGMPHFVNATQKIFPILVGVELLRLVAQSVVTVTHGGQARAKDGRKSSFQSQYSVRVRIVQEDGESLPRVYLIVEGTNPRTYFPRTIHAIHPTRCCPSQIISIRKSKPSNLHTLRNFMYTCRIWTITFCDESKTRNFRNGFKMHKNFPNLFGSDFLCSSGV